MNIMPRVLRPEEFRRRAHALYSAGVEYLALWDCDQRNELSSSWEGLARLGHRQEIESWVKAGGPDLSPSSTMLQRLDGLNMKYGRPG